MKPRLLDLFCGAGGCACGYVRAGFEVFGVDNRPHKNYLKSGASGFVQADALEYCCEHGREFDAIHASPPCQRFSSFGFLVKHRHPDKPEHPDLLTPTRELLKVIGVPWVIENVPRAPLARGSTMLCGTMFGLMTADGRAELRRHRYFETSFGAILTPECRHGGSRQDAPHGRATVLDGRARAGDGNRLDDGRGAFAGDPAGVHGIHRGRVA